MAIEPLLGRLIVVGGNQQGTVGAAPAIERKKGFEAVAANFPDIKIVKTQSGDFTTDGGKKVMEAFLKTAEGKSANVLYAHNDDMAIGAIQAIKEAGKQPGKDIVIVSVDGVRDALTAIKAGELNCSVECYPLLGPALFDAVELIVAKKPIPKKIFSKESMFTEDDFKDPIKGAQLLAGRKY